MQESQETQPKKETKLLERKQNRRLLVFYDLLIFVICGSVVFYMHPSQVRSVSLHTAAVNLAVAAVCIFGMRFLFKVYKQIWRINQMRSFARLFTADILGSALYLSSRMLFEHVFGEGVAVAFTLSLLVVTIDLLVAVFSRIVYYYLYINAQRDTSISKTIKNFLRVIGLVDFDSPEPGALLTIALQQAQKADEPINEMQRVIRQFAIRGVPVEITQMNKGYINRTYKVETLSDTGHTHKYTLQRINTNVFPDIDALMENFVRVTDHLHGKYKLPGARDGGCVQALRSAKNGKSYVRDDSGAWRMMTHFDHVYSLDIPDMPETFFYAGQAFGTFIKEMADYDPAKIHTVIPNFHNTESRYEDLEGAIARDAAGRVKDVQPEIAFVREHKYLYPLISTRLENGTLPLRICHNDCNLNNILFDENTHLPVAIIDLDTVMTSSPLYDFGDSMRVGTNTATDDEKDLSKVSCSLEMYESYARGYLQACGDILTEEELRMLPYACLVITSEDGIRFLMDHIDGDTYYNIFYPGQNLDRARTQLALLADMERKLPEIKVILRKIYREEGLAGEGFEFAEVTER